MKPIQEIAETFGKTYRLSKDAETMLKAQQSELFEAFDRELESRYLSTQLIEVEIDDAVSDEDLREAIDQQVRTFHPGFRIKEIIPRSGQVVKVKVLLEEDPSLLKYTFPNPADGMVYGRTVSQGGASLDDQRLKEEHPEIWEKITVWPDPWWSLVRKCIDEFSNFNDDLEYDKILDTRTAYFLETQGVQKVLVPWDHLPQEEKDLVDSYRVPGSISAKLVPPRKAKSEELA